MAAGLLVGLVALPTGSADATFHGDNGRIAFRRFFNADQTWGAIFTISPDGSRERQVTFPPDGFVDRNPDISPDGKRILFQRQHVVCADGETGCPSDEIWVVDANGAHATRLTRQPHAGATCDNDGYCDVTPAWSPSGRRIVFSRITGPYDPAEDLIERVALFTMHTDGSHARQLTQKVLPATGEDTEPQWSPDGRRILFQRWNVRTAEPVDTVALWVLDLRSGHQRQITPSSLMAGDTPDWSPNGKLILFHDWLEGPPPGALRQPLDRPARWHPPAPAHVRRRRRDHVPRLVVLARRHPDRVRPQTRHGWTRRQRGRRLHDAPGRNPRTSGHPDLGLRQLPGLGPSPQEPRPLID